MAYGNMNDMTKKKKKKPMKKTKKRDLTNKQKEKLKLHAANHTKRHITLMKKMMKEGKSFSAAHKAAIKEIGK
jgi:hypothetical protein